MYMFIDRVLKDTIVSHLQLACILMRIHATKRASISTII